MKSSTEVCGMRGTKNLIDDMATFSDLPIVLCVSFLDILMNWKPLDLHTNSLFDQVCGASSKKCHNLSVNHFGRPHLWLDEFIRICTCCLLIFPGDSLNFCLPPHFDLT